MARQTLPVMQAGDAGNDALAVMQGMSNGANANFTELYEAVGTGMALDPSPDSDQTGQGTVVAWQAGEAMAFGEAAYLTVTKLYKAKADTAATGPAFALSLGAVGADGAGDFLLYGVVRNDAWNWASIGRPVYLSAATSGALTQTAPSGDGEIVQILGIALSADTLLFNPQYVTVEIDIPA